MVNLTLPDGYPPTLPDCIGGGGVGDGSVTLQHITRKPNNMTQNPKITPAELTLTQYFTAQAIPVVTAHFLKTILGDKPWDYISENPESPGVDPLGPHYEDIAYICASIGKSVAKEIQTDPTP